MTDCLSAAHQFPAECHEAGTSVGNPAVDRAKDCKLGQRISPDGESGYSPDCRPVPKLVFLILK
jgi:hypothetical protein